MAAPRSIGSVTITIECVVIPTKLYTATSKRKVDLHRLERATGARVRQPTVSSVSGRDLGRDDVISGYEYTPEKYVTFEPAELKALEQQAQPDRIRIVAAVPAETFDPTHVEGSVFLGPDKGGERSYHLLANGLALRGLVAIGQWGGRTRDELVVLAPHLSGKGLVMHYVLYPDEIRRSTLDEAVPTVAKLSGVEIGLCSALIAKFERPTFEAALADLVDRGAERIRATVDRKVAGHEVVVPPARVDNSPLDLLEQLRASVGSDAGPKKARAGGAPSSRMQPRKRARAS
ncbi:MAG: hypothetical protein KF782_34810 [Labilithrix sp.]|nr:hypothetical protein [Labilithrix sp.]